MRAVHLLVVSMLATASGAQDAVVEKLIADGHWKQARAMVAVQIGLRPSDPQLAFFLSQIRNAFGDHTTPLGLAEKAVALAPKVARYHRQLAEVQGVMAQNAGALQQLFLARKFRKEIDAAIELDPRDLQALRDLLEFYLLAPGIVGGDVKKADAVASRIAVIDAAEGFLAQARVAEFRKDYQRAEDLTRSAAQTAPSSYKAAIALAQFHIAPEHRNEAAGETEARRALALEPGRVDAHSMLAAILAGRSEWTQLEALLSAASNSVPDDATPFYRAADRLISSGAEPGRAERYLRRYLSQEPEGNGPPEADARRLLGLALEAEGRMEAAVQQWTLAVQLDSSSPAARDLKRARESSTRIKGRQSRP